MSKKMIFWLVTLSSVLIGGVFGLLIAHFSAGKESDSWVAFKWYFVFPYDAVFYVMAIACLVLLVLVIRGLQTLNKHSRETVDDELHSPAERAVSKLYMQATILLSLATVWVFVGAVHSLKFSEEHNQIVIFLTLSSVVMVTVGWLLSRIVTKKMNQLVPRLAIDLHEVNPQKQYNNLVQRMDESETLQMYKAGFTAMRSMLMLLYVVLVVIFLYSMLVESQINLLLVVGLLVIANQMFYFIAIHQQTKRKKG